MDNINNEIPKFRKKKKSSVSKSKEKSKHKHEYVDCLLIKSDKPYKATYCKVCGKVGKVSFFETEKTDHDTYRMLNADEVLRKYNDLKKIYIDDIWQKYVPMNN